ncbi:MAG: hypothetical protein IPK52_21810 [Chloroflexi bacterium]|nr:hypothetical protein [Chloroflexota bacterium]
MTDLNPPWLEQGLQAGWYVDWQGHTYRIRTFDAAKLVLHIEHLVTAEVRTVALETLLLPSADDSAPLFAPLAARAGTETPTTPSNVHIRAR